ncbi:MAG: hypothetical protein INQ03_10290 [Candidatus Heimdallarchaeota archaeon]|nr:hypothetical protein [Candidatus Heimdallarchaeota archaeon]
MAKLLRLIAEYKLRCRAMRLSKHSVKAIRDDYANNIHTADELAEAYKISIDSLIKLLDNETYYDRNYTGKYIVGGPDTSDLFDDLDDITDTLGEEIKREKALKTDHQRLIERALEYYTTKSQERKNKGFTDEYMQLLQAIDAYIGSTHRFDHKIDEKVRSEIINQHLEEIIKDIVQKFMDYNQYLTEI